jgi:hypothetical protein
LGIRISRRERLLSKMYFQKYIYLTGSLLWWT